MFGTMFKATRAPQPNDPPGTPSEVWMQKFAGHTIADDLWIIGLHELPTDAGKIMQAWRARVKMEYGSDVDMDAMKQARDRLMLAVEKGAHERINQLEESACKMCGGSGRIGSGFGHDCPACKGTGVRNGPTG